MYSKRFFILLFFTGLLSFEIKSQEIFETESDTHIFWQENRVLKKEDFQGNGESYEKSRFYCDSLDMCTVASVGVYAVLDIPKKRKSRGKLFERAYFVPMFEKATSYILNENDSLGTEKQQIVFDIYEISARYARKELNRYFGEMGNSYGAISLLFSTVNADAKKLKKELIDAYTKDVYILRTDSAYYKWREFIDNGLENFKEYATTPEDCYRAITKKPLDKRYIEPEMIVGNLFEDEK
ncbi:MAG: hypothetical protein PUB21_02380 [Bacteroidales bacterium]|nr:hypothetical protein [Bacteroidales bacterium]